LDVIFTIVSRNYAAQAATLMQSLAAAEPKARRVVVATDGPIPQLARLAEVIDAQAFDLPYKVMSVYYDALELNTAVKPYVFKHFLGEAGVGSATYLDPDIFAYRPLDRVREGLSRAQLVLTPHLTRPLLGAKSPNDQIILRSGSFNLGFCSARAEDRTRDLMAWWADRCEFDCRVDLPDGLFTDQRWMDLSPGFVDSLDIVRDPGLNLAYWNLEGRTLARGKAGWTVDGHPLQFFHFSGFDPTRPGVLSKHQNRVQAKPGSPLAELLADYAAAMLANGHRESAAIPYAHKAFPSGRAVTRPMRRRALRAARDGMDFSAGLEAALVNAPDITRVMAEVWRETPSGFQLDHEAGRTGFHRFFAEHAKALGADAASGAAAKALLSAFQAGAREPDASVWRDAPWTGPAAGAFDWLREPAAGGTPRAIKALLAARRDLRSRFSDDAQGLLAWCLGAEAPAGRFAPDLLPADVLDALARDPSPLFDATRLAEPGAGELGRKLSAGFGVAARGAWPAAITEALRAPFLERVRGQPAPFIRLFLEIWDARPDVQLAYPLRNALGRARYLRWLAGGGLAEYGVEFDALPAAVRNHPMMQAARLSVRRRLPPTRVEPAERIAELWVVDGEDMAREAAADRMVYAAATGRFLSPKGPAQPPAHVQEVRFLTHPDLVPADAMALRRQGVRWARAVGVWDAATAAGLSADSVGLGFVDEVLAPVAKAGFRPVRAPPAPADRSAAA